jgi:hypothetical protein
LTAEAALEHKLHTEELTSSLERGGTFEERVFSYTPWTLGLYHGAWVEGVISAAGEDMLLADGFSRLCMIPRCGHWLVLDLYRLSETMVFGNGPTDTLRITKTAISAHHRAIRQDGKL